MAPLPSTAVFYAATEGGQEGPMLADELVAAVAAGRFTPGTLVWWPDAEGWVPFETQPELAAQLAAHGAGDGDAVSETEAEAETDSGPPRVAALATERSDEELDGVFAGLVEASWRYHHLLDDTTRVDEVFVGALIASTLETGRALIDLDSDGTHHFLRFEDPQDRSRVSIQVTHLTRDVTTAKAVGQRASVVVGYGEPLKSFAKVFGAMRQEAKSGYLATSEPGVVTFDADGESHYLYTLVPLFMDLDEYISPKFDVDYAKLSEHVAATVHALRKFLRNKVEQES